jgi:hypothetical protein
LAEWFPTFLNRYDGYSVAEAGLIAGAVTVLGGIFGTVLGSKVTGYCENVLHIKGSYFLIPALFTVPAAIVLMIAINLQGHPNQGLVAFLIFLSEVMLWTFLAPLGVISISCIPVPLRARSCGVCILLMHVLGEVACVLQWGSVLSAICVIGVGDVIAPPIVGGISTSTGSLRTGMQVTWLAILVSGVWWFCGYYFLVPFRPPKDGENKEDIGYISLLCKVSLVSPYSMQSFANNVLKS